MSRSSRQSISKPPPPAATRGWARDGLAGFFLVAATLAVFWPVLSCDFTNFDDTFYVTENARVKNGLSWNALVWAFSSIDLSNWHPVTWLSHMMDVELYGLKPWGHHLTNLLFHAANAALLFVLLRRLTGALWRSLMVAALFAVHPLHVESVAWVAERKDVLSAFFGLLSLICYARYAGQKTRGDGQWARGSIPTAPRPLPIAYCLSLTFFALGLMSKPMLVTWPFVMLLLDWWPMRRFTIHDSRFAIFRRLLLEKVPFFALSAVSSIVTVIAQKHGGAVISLTKIPFGERVQNTFVSYVTYLSKTFWPVDLAVYYPHTPLSAGIVVVCVALVIALLVVAVACHRQHPYVAVGWLWFLGVLVPVIGLVQVGGQALADRYSYLPLIGIFIGSVWLAAWALERWRAPRDAALVSAIVVLMACAWQTRAQLVYWRESEALWRHALAVTVENEVAVSNLGSAIYGKGREQEAVDLFQRALEIDPDYPPALSSLGMIQIRRGEYETALENFQKALRTMPDPWSAHNNLGITLVKMGRVDEGMEHYRAALRLNPALTVVHHNLGMAFVIKGRLEQAVECFRDALKFDPRYAPSHKNLGSTYARLGRRDEAIREVSEALRLDPGNADARALLQTLLSSPANPQNP